MNEKLVLELQKVIDSPLKDSATVEKIVAESNLKIQKYILQTEKCFSSNPEQLKKEFTI